VFGETYHVDTNEFEQGNGEQSVLEAQAQAFSEISRSLTQAVEQAQEQAADIIRRAQEHAMSVVNAANERAAEAGRKAADADQRAAEADRLATEADHRAVAAEQRVAAAETRLAGLTSRIDQSRSKLSAIAQQAAEIARLASEPEEGTPVASDGDAYFVHAETSSASEHASPAVAEESPGDSAHEHQPAEAPLVLAAWDSEASHNNGWGNSHTSTHSSSGLDPLGVLASLRHAVDNAGG
jgi:hypothetical protein